MHNISSQQAKVLNLLHLEREKAKKKLEPKIPAYVWKFDKENYKLKKVSTKPEQLSLI